MSALAPPVRFLEKIASTCWSESEASGLSLWTNTASMSMATGTTVGA